MKEVRVRFAPSPTGFFHVGGARTALFDWLYAAIITASLSFVSKTPTARVITRPRCPTFSIHCVGWACFGMKDRRLADVMGRIINPTGCIFTSSMPTSSSLKGTHITVTAALNG